MDTIKKTGRGTELLHNVSEPRELDRPRDAGPRHAANTLHVVPAGIREVLLSSRALRVLLLTDFLVLLSELTAMVALPWWITSRGGAHAIAAFSVALAVATFIAAPAVSPFGDRICKGRQITWGLGCLCLIASMQAGLSYAGSFSLAVLIALAVVQVLARSFVDPARDAVLTELIAPEQLPAAIRIRKATQAVGGIFGPLLAGVAIGSAGVTGALCLYCGLLFTAMLVASRTRASRLLIRNATGWLCGGAICVQALPPNG